ncbi:MAG: carboxypeptidase-like regulatory domain-containing protein [Fibrobacteria bacterium]
MRKPPVQTVFLLLIVMGMAKAGSAAGGVISGFVKDVITGNPLAGAKVNIFEIKAMRHDPLSDSVLTGADGSFRFTGLTPQTELGGYQIHARLDRYWDSYVNLFKLADGEETQIEVPCGKIFSVTILVRDASAPLLPLPGAHVLMNPARWHPTGVNGVTGGQGEIVFKDLNPGAIGLTAAREGFLSSFIRDTLGAAWKDTLMVLLQKDAEGQAKTITGSVRTVSGKIISDSPVLFGCREPDDGAVYFGLGSVDGGFTISGIPAACVQGELLLQYYPDSMKVELPTRETLKGFVIQDPPGSLGVASKAQAPPPSPLLGLPWFRNFTLLGRWRTR